MARVGYWVTEKKKKKLNFEELEVVCGKEGIEIVQIDLNRSVEEQGPFQVIFHKLTDTVTYAERGEKKAINQIQNLMAYLSAHPDVVLLDPLINIRQLQDRHQQYQLIQECQNQQIDPVFFTPSFVEFTSSDVETNREILKQSKVTFPFVCKPSSAHGSKVAHKMCIIFNEKGLKDVQPPCVAQSFINHNAVLYKIYIIGARYYIVERPSLKNFRPGDQETIFFDSHDVSKADSSSFLNKLEPWEKVGIPHRPDRTRLYQLVHAIQMKMQLTLFGVDVIVENNTGRCAVIDINAFPGYDGVPDYFQVMCQFLKDCLECHRTKLPILQTFHSKDNGESTLVSLYGPDTIPSWWSQSINGFRDMESLGQKTNHSNMSNENGDPALQGLKNEDVNLLRNGHIFVSSTKSMHDH